MATINDVAMWMLASLKADGALYQDVAASQIYDLFGEEFTAINQNGNLSIQKAVLTAFNKLTPEGVVWVRSQRMWRPREDYDLPGRQQT